MRGRRPKSDDIKALTGNPGHRRLSPGAGRSKPGSAPSASEIMPRFLTQAREKEIFRRVIDEYLQRRIARPSDANAYGRYCAWLDRWWTCKEALDGKTTWYDTGAANSVHGKIARRHPLFKDMLEIERILDTLECRLGLNVVARQAIVRGLAVLPASLGSPAPDQQSTETPSEQDQPLPSPIGIGLLN